MEEASTPAPQQNEYFIDRYNQVVEIYNNSEAGGIQLEQLDNSRTFLNIHKTLSKTLVKVLMVVLLAFLPFVNLFIFGTLVFYLLFLRREGKKHRNNLKRVRNPMESYYFLPEICHQLGKHCTTLQIKTNGNPQVT